MPHPDLEPATRRLAELVRSVPDDGLGAPTPCPAYSLGDLLDHVHGLSVAFTVAATKDSLDGPGTEPSGDASRLGDDWQERIPAALIGLGTAWRDAAAWTGVTKAGPIDMPGDVAGLVALNEVVVHGWDVARALGRAYEPDEASVAACHELVLQFSGPGSEEARAGAFGPVVEVADDGPLIDRLIGLTGRDPAWAPPG